MQENTRDDVMHIINLHWSLIGLVAGQLSDMMGTDLTKVSNFVRQFCRPYLLIFLLGPLN